MSAVTVYTTGRGCPRCVWTLRRLDERGIPYREVDLSAPSSAAAREYVTDDLGYTEAPVVVVSDQDHWSGFDRDLIDRITPPQEDA